MADTVIAFVDPSIVLDVEGLVAAARTAWPAAVYTPATGTVASTSVGRLELHEHGLTVFVDILSDNDGMGVEGDDHLAAALIAWLTQQIEIPHGDAVVATGWSSGLLALRAHMTRDELLGLRA